MRWTTFLWVRLVSRWLGATLLLMTCAKEKVPTGVRRVEVRYAGCIGRADMLAMPEKLRPTAIGLDFVGCPVRIEKITVRMDMPGHAMGVAPVELRRAGKDAIFMGTLTYTMAGEWRVRIHVTGEAGEERTEYDITVR